MPRGIIERGSWQIHVVALISQCAQFQWPTPKVSLITPVKRVENHGSPWLVSVYSAPLHALLPQWCVPVRVVYFTVRFSTLLTGRCGRNCLYLNWLSNQYLAKRSSRKVGLADSCRGPSLAMPSSSIYYHECVTNHSCQEGRKSGLSLFGFRKFCACPLIMATQMSLLRISVAEPRSEMPAR